ncbi:etoposide-induced protein 2.4-domain-containing protein [Gilbertella persicaria]|uniref:etoposide-induced protein 2.4-domain-containing protein n=1 Tax=Gilbertella persicaria TaxID=101096 RepID=UPI0022212529|nr:etoposide-induced protein 2.4-domain-containing protein [Gilbertella persicaria]KAI8048764.1 etoposide-induced protein 2.4-domain-containing protein [Gilbertella persicaria]
MSCHFKYLFKGIQDAFDWPRVFALVITSKPIQSTLIKSVALNGVVYLGMLVFIETFYNSPDHHLYGYSYADLTGYPLYLICLLVNSRLYNKIAQQQHDNTNIFDSIYTILLYGHFALFIALLKYIPWVGSILSFLLYCMVMTYYCFEYTWIDWSIEQRMTYIEQHWAYCLGFGLPATTITFFLSTLRAGGVFALIYPTYIMMASSATPVPSSIQKEPVTSLPVFVGIRYMHQFMMRSMRSFIGTPKTHKDDLGKLV